MGGSRRTDALHLIAGLAVALAASAYVGFHGYFFIDEAALYGQLEVMEEGGWTVSRPFPDRDPDAEHVPMARSDVAGDEYAPFAKHPVHVLLARGAHMLGGEVGVRVLSSLALVVAAAAAGALAGGGGLRRRAAFWLTLAATPLLFDANLVVAHTLGAAVAGALFAVALRARPAPATWGAAFVLACFGGVLRHEVLLLLGAGSLVLGVRALRRRSVPGVITALMLLSGGACAYLVEPLLVRWAIGGNAGLETAAPTAGSAARDVVAAATRSLFEVNATTARTGAILGLVGCAALIAATAFIAGRTEPDRHLASVTAGLALAGSAVFVAQPHLVTGLVWAFPALLLLAAARSGSTWLEAPLRTALVVSGLFAVLVAATQYSQGGGLEWGWRYVAVAVPLLTPAIAAVLERLWSVRHSGVPAVAVVAVLAASVAVQLGGLRYQREVMGDTDHFLDRVGEVAADASADWVVSTDASFGRFAYELSVGGDVATVANADVGGVLGWLRDQEVDTVLLVWRLDEPPPDPALGGYRRTERSWVVASGYEAVLLEAG